MTDERQDDKRAQPETVFVILNAHVNARVVEQSQAIDEQANAIRRLERITQTLDAPFVGSYLSV